MRLWSLHPQYLDTSGLTACWREALLARQVLLGKTKGYRQHPQLERFRQTSLPAAAINTYLTAILVEADRRGYRFDISKIDSFDEAVHLIPVSSGQLEFERQHLLNKLKQRAPQFCPPLETVSLPKPHPLFIIHEGDIEPWEKGSPEKN